MPTLISGSAIQEQLKQMALMQECDLDWFDYNIFGVALPTTGANDSFSISSDSDFLLFQINGSAFQPAGTNIANPDILLDISDDGSERSFSTDPIHWVTIVGNAQNPGTLNEPKLITKKSTITVALTNLSGGAFARVDLAFRGVKIFYTSQFRREDLAAYVPGVTAVYRGD